MTTREHSTSRRSFLKTGLILGGAIPVVSGLTQLAHADPTTAVNPEDAQPKALGYVHDGATVDVKIWTKKAGPDGDKQKCSSCALYLQGGLKAEGQEGEWGKCAIFPNALVAGNGWCNSWAPKG